MNKHSQSYRKDPIDRAMMGRKPEWLEKLLTEKRFFSACEVHKAEKKNENNVFCVDCHGAICQHCVPCHRHGYRQPSLLQIRRYVYHDVIRLQDIEKLIDCSFVQPYIINSAKVVFLNPRPQSRPSKSYPGGGINACGSCDRNLQERFRFCCVACKVESYMRRGEQNLRKILPNPNPNPNLSLDLGLDPVLGHDQLSPLSVIPLPRRSLSPSSDSSSNSSSKSLLNHSSPNLRSSCQSNPRLDAKSMHDSRNLDKNSLEYRHSLINSSQNFIKSRPTSSFQLSQNLVESSPPWIRLSDNIIKSRPKPIECGRQFVTDSGDGLIVSHRRRLIKSRDRFLESRHNMVGSRADYPKCSAKLNQPSAQFLPESPLLNYPGLIRNPICSPMIAARRNLSPSVSSSSSSSSSSFSYVSRTMIATSDHHHYYYDNMASTDPSFRKRRRKGEPSRSHLC